MFCPMSCLLIESCDKSLQTPAPGSTDCNFFIANSNILYSARSSTPAECLRVPGLDGLSMPSGSQVAELREASGLRLPAEVQSLALKEETPGGEHMVAAVDSYGTAMLLHSAQGSNQPPSLLKPDSCEMCGWLPLPRLRMSYPAYTVKAQIWLC